MTLDLLLDTQVVIWWLADHRSLSRSARAIIADGENLIAVSAATPWEIAIKRAAGRLRVKGDIAARLASERFVPLPISHNHAWLAGELPLYHHDPFDRMIVAQAMLEGFTIVTSDPLLAPYGVSTFPA